MKKSTRKVFIHSQRLAGYLMIAGFVLQGITADRTGGKRNIFIFNETDSLCDAMANYKVRR